MGQLGPRSNEPICQRWPALNAVGEPTELMLTSPTLIVAVKADCDGCAAFYTSDLEQFGDLRVVLVADQYHDPSTYDGAQQEIVTAPELLAALAIRWPPFYCLLRGDPLVTAIEGVAFGPEQVAGEIASALN